MQGGGGPKETEAPGSRNDYVLGLAIFEAPLLHHFGGLIIGFGRCRVPGADKGPLWVPLTIRLV